MPPINSHYDNLYGKGSPFGKEPLEFIKEILSCKNSGEVLDLGAGDGRNSIFLARKGFHVTAVDISRVAIQKIKDIAKKEKLPLTGIVQDITEFPFQNTYDVIILSFVLHHLNREKVKELMENAKNYTKQEGLNLIATFTKNGDFYKQKPDAQKFYPDPEELKTFYTDWKILKWQEKQTKALQKTDEGNAMFNLTSFLLTQKKMGADCL